jgi:hypothetical protein
MPKHYKAPNKRIIMRSSNGRFRKTRQQDFGVGGVCHCGHLLQRHYEGDERDEFLDPSKLIYRCFTCEPLTEAEENLEAEIEASKPKKRTIEDALNQYVEEHYPGFSNNGYRKGLEPKMPIDADNHC